MNVAGSLFFVKYHILDWARATRGSCGFLEITEENLARWKRALGSPARIEVEFQDQKVSDRENSRGIAM